MGNIWSKWRLSNRTFSNTRKYDLTAEKRIAKVLYVYDGDTVALAVKYRSHVYKIDCRLYGINACELTVREDTPNKNQIILKGARAREALREKVLNKFVVAEFQQQDKHGRWLVCLYKDSGILSKTRECINDYMLANGHAVRYFEETQIHGPTDIQINPVVAMKNSEEMVGGPSSLTGDFQG
jgi:endonuclease YncB( thermonuclease family)